ncbi:MAG: epoxyqueuosine reductase [Firmicutes bacterium]|nr:epoxyqueuosine reductase [Bacillota bacterium]
MIAEHQTIKGKIQTELCSLMKKYEESEKPSTKWGLPLVGFADAKHPFILNLKTIVSPNHELPTDVLNDASIVIAYYIPFTKALAKTNITINKLASSQWALAYEETNAMFKYLNKYMIDYLNTMGYKAAISKESSTFSTKKLISNWSHRHFAYIAGLGTFGINNMLITKNGCCGRFSSIVTNLAAVPDNPMINELCLYKNSGSCKVCVKNCPVGALTELDYNRTKCYTMLKENAAIYTEFGNSYLDETLTKATSIGSEVCGKCITSSPCAFLIAKS